MVQPSLSFDPIDEARRHWEERWTEEAATEFRRAADLTDNAPQRALLLRRAAKPAE